MNYYLIRSEEFQTKPWSGGTTTELFIFPPTADYRQRNFLFRLSTATVKTEQSEFTPLPGVSRKLMVLSGGIHIMHETRYSKQLSKFEVDTFEGDWKTSSIGLCTDFNLMTTGTASGELRAISIQKEESLSYIFPEKEGWVFLYLFSGFLNVEINEEISTMEKGDLLVIPKPKQCVLVMSGIENSEVVISVVS